MAVEIYSRLYKSAMLGGNSTRFSSMVGAACWHHGIEPGTDVVQFCASRVDIVDGLRLHVGESIDEVLSELIQTDEASGMAVDNLIFSAVTEYTNLHPST